jgi:hypothetical protein
MSLTFVRTIDQQHLKDLLLNYYASPERPSPSDVAVEAERRLVVWGDGVEPDPPETLGLRISPPSDGWIAVAFSGATAFDLPLTAWLARELRTEAIAAYTWGDGYGCVAFDAQGVIWSQGHIRDERSDMHLRQWLRDSGVPFDGDEDRNRSGGTPGWVALAVPPRPWPPIPSQGAGGKT